jgi:hypothetical protein
LGLYNVDVELGRGEKRQKSDDFISARLHARPKLSQAMILSRIDAWDVLPVRYRCMGARPRGK